MTVSPETGVAGLSLNDATDRGLLDSDVHVGSVERDGAMLTPKGDTEIRPDDLVMVFSPHEGDEQPLSAFGAGRFLRQQTPAF